MTKIVLYDDSCLATEGRVCQDGTHILGRPVTFSNFQDADDLHNIRKRMPIPFE